jgi:hypothetical protein
MKQIIKVESFITMYFKDSWAKNSKHFENRSDLIVKEVAYDMAKGYSWSKGDYVKFKQISYQYFDFEKQEWVVLPNPTQPKIEEISFSEEEGVNDNE